MATITKHIPSTVDNLRDASGGVHEINAAFVDGRSINDLALAGNYITTDTEQTVSAKKTFSATPVLSSIKNTKVLGTDANGLIKAQTLGINDIDNLQNALNNKANSDHNHFASQIIDLQSKLDEKLSSYEQFTGNLERDGLVIYGKSNVRNVGDDKSGNVIYSAFIDQDHPTSGHSEEPVVKGVFNTESGSIIGTGNFAASEDAASPDKILNLKGVLVNTDGAYLYDNSKRRPYDSDTRFVVASELNGKANASHRHGISDVDSLESTLDGKMDAYIITDSPSSMSKDGFAQFKYGINYQLTKYSNLQRAFGYVNAVEKGGQISNNNSYFTGFGEVGGGTYIGTAIYDRDYTSSTDALYASHGLLIDGYGSAFLLYGSRDSETMKEIATKDDTNGKQDTLVSGTNIKTINGNSILGSGNLNINTSLPANSDVTLQTLSFHGGTNYSISGIYVLETDAVSLNGSVGSNASINFSIDRSYYSDFSSGRWYYVATPTSGGYIDTIAVGVEATTSGSGGGKIWIRRVSSGNTQNYKVTVYCIRQY